MKNPVLLTFDLSLWPFRLTWVIWTWRLWLPTSPWMVRTSSSIPSARRSHHLRSEAWEPTSRASAMSQASSNPWVPLQQPTSSPTWVQEGISRASTEALWHRGHLYPTAGAPCRCLPTMIPPAPRCPLWEAVRICSGRLTLRFPVRLEWWIL